MLSSPAGAAIALRGFRLAQATLAPVTPVAHVPARETPCAGPRDFLVEDCGSHVAGRCVGADSVENVDGSESYGFSFHVSMHDTNAAGYCFVLARLSNQKQQ